MRTPDVGIAGRRLAKNVATLRKQRRLSYRDLEALLRERGHPILASGLLKLERGERRVDVDELTALAWVLGPMPPGRLLSEYPAALLTAVEHDRHREAIGRAAEAIASVCDDVSPRAVLDYLDMAVFSVVVGPTNAGDVEANPEAGRGQR